MDFIRDILRQFYSVLIIFAAISFVAYVFFSANYNGGEGVFENVGNVYVPVIEDEELQNIGLNDIGKEANPFVPEIQYNSGVKQVGDCIKFKELFEVKTEGDFALYLVDIKRSGNSVLEFLSSEELENLEEIPSSFVYDKEQDLLYIFGSGIYTVEIKVYGSSGALEKYEFNLPVEIS